MSTSPHLPAPERSTPQDGADRKPWHGVVVATALPLREDLSVDFDAYAEHVRWLVDSGCDGVCPNGSLGEYQSLTPEERARVVRVAVDAVGGDRVLPGVAAYGAAESLRWTEQAAEAGARAVMLLPPNSYRADTRTVVDHYRTVARAGLPIVAYNNPFDTKVDLTPRLLADLYEEGLVVGVKEFTGDVRRAYEVAELAPGLDVLIGSDDVALEFGLAGAVGWIAGYANVFPRASVELYRAAVQGDPRAALPLYRLLHPLLRLDARTEFVQSIKLSMDLAGLRGGPCRAPRLPLLPEQEAFVRESTEKALAEGLN
ncbi:dihydrodipicolinate synthase family protein [Embleya hyalina]|uniref:Dihydrodipicolinate synthase family protein n=1 Tax=Embleya hyalina TaxID=516124 RepID=A0A401YFL2_9ACTN|nr:dihydrodipicolinate synthase family protein [Embleya hyalina]GCD93395.1 dihydrodipicolinate synthase family protein [Embleya hyalina]